MRPRPAKESVTIACYGLANQASHAAAKIGAPEVELVKIAILAAAIPWIVPAHAHSWYPRECCVETHCNETDRVRELPDGSAEVQVGSETIVVPRWLKRRTSPDKHYHLCYNKMDEFTLFYCFFEPAQA